MIWTPQILYNIINNNKYIYPFIYIFFSTSNIIIILLISYLFDIFDANKYILIICYIYIILSVVILYLQTFLGPRFMLPSKFHKKEFSIYKSSKEILKEKSKSTIYNEICIICFATILNIAKKEQNKVNNKITIDTHIKISNENNNCITTKRNYLISNNNNQSDNNNINNNINNISNTNQSLRIIKKSIKLFINALKILGFNLKNILSEGLFSFYIMRGNLKNKEIMLLPCGHIYHSICLSEWLERKRICPICSKSIPEI
jgi:hypothetical protein